MSHLDYWFVFAVCLGQEALFLIERPRLFFIPLHHDLSDSKSDLGLARHGDYPIIGFNVWGRPMAEYFANNANL